ncbi:hypothetical protein JG687_00009919 [Phytophthora cactorum]|uniref:Uncharacterized protein n=1 Tax=Phytophthora cactorum TaxID=29920 RepID=A0A8T1U890_9STRA|nr:hypothetical protein JG687_00009919 [Phytophthora cactorum]
MEPQTLPLPDLCLLIKQRDVPRLREALEAHPTLIQQQRWLSSTNPPTLQNKSNPKFYQKSKKTPLQWAVRAGKASVAYRIDQQLHAKAKLALQQAREQQQSNKSPLTFAKLCG